MKIILELSEEEVHALRPLADAAGVDFETVLHHLIAQLLPPVVLEKPKGLQENQTEENQMEEDAERRREQEEMQANIRRWHAEQKTN